MTDELALSSSVSLAEGVQCIQLSKVVRSSFTKSHRAKPGEMVLLGELPEDRLGNELEIAVMGKPIAAFADVDVA